MRDDWRGTGVADDMMRTLVQVAKSAGVRELYGDVLHANARMLAFMRRHGMEPGICEPSDDRSLVRIGCLFPLPALAPAASAGAVRRSGWRGRLAALASWRPHRLRPRSP